MQRNNSKRTNMIITFDFEGGDEGAAFFALYAGLRMYKELKDAQPKPKGLSSVPAAEAFIMLEHLKEKHLKLYLQCETEYNSVYASKTPQL